MKEGEVYFSPDPGMAARSSLADFTAFLENEVGTRFADYTALHRFSVAEFRRFWAAFLRWSRLEVEGSDEPVCRGDDVETAVFYPDLRLSYAGNLLRSLDAASDMREALVAVAEDGVVQRLTRAGLRDRVSRAAAGLAARGLASGERVVAVARNNADTVVACLAATGLGASWSSTT